MNILQTTQDIRNGHELAKLENAYIEDIKLSISHYGYTTRITNINNAMSSGKYCETITIKWYDQHLQDNAPMNVFFRMLEEKGLKGTFQFFLEEVFNNPIVTDEYGNYESADYKGLELHFNAEKSIRTFTPFKKLNRLNKTPKKWTKSHVIRLLINNQYKDLECRQYLTDDYAHDAAVNFKEGWKLDGLEMAKELVEEGSRGYWFNFNEETSYLGINQHSFNYNGCLVYLDNGTPLSKEPKNLDKKQTLNIVNNKEKKGVELRFSGKPALEIRQTLKENGFRFSRKQKMWYAKQCDASATAVRAIKTKLVS